MQLTATDGATIHCNRLDLRDAWAVYHVFAVPPGQVESALVFIGLSKLSSVYMIADANGNRAFMESYAQSQLAIRLTHIGPKVECSNERMRQVRQYKPECNLRGISAANGRGLMIRCVDTGETFYSANQAAAMYGIAPSNMSYHLAGKPGYKTVRGLTFERIQP